MSGGEASSAEPVAPAGPRRLIVLRHGQTDHNAKGIWQGQLDSDLSERGHAQARAAARALAEIGPTRVVASDLKRAAHTGADLARECGIPITYDARLREMHVGEWSGLTSDEVAERYPEDAERLLRGEDFRRGGHGESVADVALRVRELTGEVIAGMAPGECVVLACHGVTARALVADLIGLDQQVAWTILGGFGNCHWAELVEGSRGWRIQTWNASAPDAP
ncbi:MULTISPECIES: histidine phosphatase family protein [unclassified Janibacter]|uniref:histidine phosphatase family protein n=1 Tax=unclassified Janibacter TaxID=2649294 RepID=UPI003CFDD956